MTPPEPPKIARFVASAAGKEKVAEAIANGRTVPEWLLDCTWNLIDLVHGNIERDLDWPNLEEWRERFDNLQKSAQFVLHEISDFREMLPMLLDSSGDCLENENEMKHGREALVARCNERIRRIPDGKGRKKAKVSFDGTPRSETLCALIVAIAWEKVHGAWPSSRNEKVGAACLELWQAGGGKERAGPGGAGSWRVYLEDAGARRDSWQAHTLMTMMSGG